MLDLKISLIQTSVFWEDQDANLSHFADRLATIPSSDLVVLPEMFNTGFTMNAVNQSETMNGLTIQWMKNQADMHGIHIAGSLIIEVDNKYYNRFVKVDPFGNVSFYDKRHLFSMAGEDKVFTKGSQRVIWEVNNWKIYPQVCYDLRFPVWSRNDLQYDVLLYSANWPAKRINHWLSLIKARAIENQCYVAGLNRIGSDGAGFDYNGNSLISDYDGYNLDHNVGEDVILTASLSYEELQNRRKQFDVLRDGDGFEVK
jgi:omega-amidase